MGSKVGLGKIVTLVPTSDTVNPSIVMTTATGVVGGVALVPGEGHSISVLFVTLHCEVTSVGDTCLACLFAVVGVNLKIS